MLDTPAKGTSRKVALPDSHFSIALSRHGLRAEWRSVGEEGRWKEDKSRQNDKSGRCHPPGRTGEGAAIIVVLPGGHLLEGQMAGSADSWESGRELGRETGIQVFQPDLQKGKEIWVF